jgi:hypothetical protein
MNDVIFMWNQTREREMAQSCIASSKATLKALTEKKSAGKSSKKSTTKKSKSKKGGNGESASKENQLSSTEVVNALMMIKYSDTSANTKTDSKKAGGATIAIASKNNRNKKTGGGTIRVTNHTGKTIYVRMYKVKETWRPGSSDVDSALGPVSNVVKIDGTNTGTVPIQYTGLSLKETFTPRLTLHLYWSADAADLATNTPFQGDVQHLSRNTVRVLKTTMNVPIGSLRGGAILHRPSSKTTNTGGVSGKKKLGGGTIGVSNNTGKTLYARMYQAKETWNPASSTVVEVRLPASSIIKLDAANTSPVPIPYKDLSFKETLTPRLTLHLFWSTNQNNLNTLPFHGDEDFLNRNTVRVLKTTTNVPINSINGGMVLRCSSSNYK